MTPTPGGRGAIDLRKIKIKYPPPMEIPTEVGLDLIAAVEALQERVAELKKQPDANDFESLRRNRNSWQDATEVAEASMAELTKALAFYRADDERSVEGGILESVFDRPATAVLTATSAQALERARAVGELTKAVSRFTDESQGAGTVEYLAMVNALAKLDALGKEGG